MSSLIGEHGAIEELGATCLLRVPYEVKCESYGKQLRLHVSTDRVTAQPCILSPLACRCSA